ncbi:MAG: PfkB family carbohydrate kinase [Verrucomicrobiales bacterium]|nr:PfkB family carbohydrate kinase [Verrucomicrobiales bacterium]
MQDPSKSIVSLGAVLWDVFGAEERIGGAPFNFSVHAQRMGHEVHFISAVGRDERGARALEQARGFGLTDRLIDRTDLAPTGWVTVFIDASGQPDYTIHRPAAYDYPKLEATDLDALRERRPAWIYFGTLEQLSPQVQGVLRQLQAALPNAKRLYDVNLRKASYHAPLVRELMGQSTAVKLNEDEVVTLLREFGEPVVGIESFCRDYSRRFGWEAVLVTRGAAGSSIFLNGEFREAPGYSVEVADTVGAGDATAAALIHGIESNWDAGRIADFCNRLGALVASRSGAIPNWTMKELFDLGPTLP